MLLLVAENPSAGDLYQRWAIPFQVVAFSFAVTIGAIIECFGSELECRWDRQVASGDVPLGASNWVDSDWHTYLHQKFGDGEPVVYRYLSRKVTTFYFEVGMAFAVPIALVGTAALIFTQSALHWCAPAASLVAALGSLLLFRRFAKDTHRVLCVTRSRYCSTINKRGE
jgi:hypothetical protein